MPPGYLYVLLNPAHDGLLKIGRTARDPRTRVNELSAATGVPTPFILAYYVETAACDTLEQIVHRSLTDRGYRYAANREFFTAPLHEAIKVILSALQDLPDVDLAPDAPVEIEPSAPLWTEAFRQAEAAYHGWGDELEDKAEALRRYEQAAALGGSQALFKLGQMYLDGDGCRPDENRAVDYFKQGRSTGEARCDAELALYFAAKGHAENARKCWASYFSVATLPDNYEKFQLPFYVGRYVENGLFDQPAVKAIQSGAAYILKHFEGLEAFFIAAGDPGTAALMESRRLDVQYLLEHGTVVPPRRTVSVGLHIEKSGGHIALTFSLIDFELFTNLFTIWQGKPASEVARTLYRTAQAQYADLKLQVASTERDPGNGMQRLSWREMQILAETKDGKESAENVNLRGGDSVVWLISYTLDAEIMVKEVVIEFEAPPPFKQNILRWQKTFQASMPNIESGPSLRTPLHRTVSYVVHVIGDSKEERLRQVASLTFQ
jgi:hypothetical protein